MKRIYRAAAMLTAVFMLMAMLAGCGAKKTPAEAFVELYEEIYSVESREFDLNAEIEAEGEKITASLQGASNEKTMEAQLKGSVSMSGISIEIPEILMAQDTVYISGDGVTNLMTMLMGMDLGEELAGKYLAQSVGTTSEKSVEQSKALLGSMGTKMKEAVLSMEGAVTEAEEKGFFTLTLKGEQVLDMIKIVLNDMVEHKAEYNALIMESMAELEDGEALTAEDMDEMWSELEELLPMMDELSEEDKEFLSGISFVMTLGQNSDKTYSIAAEVAADIDGSVMKAVINGTVVPVKDMAPIEVPADVIDMEQLMESAYSDEYVYDEYDDEYEYEDDFYEEEYSEDDYSEDDLDYSSDEYSLEMLNLTQVNDDLYTIDIPVSDGSVFKLPLTDDVVLDDATVSIYDGEVYGMLFDENYEYNITFSSYSKDYFDLAETAVSYAEIMGEEDAPLTISDTTGSADGMVTCVNLYGNGTYDMLVACEVSEDEIILIDIVNYSGEDYSVVQPILDYLGVANPMADAA